MFRRATTTLLLLLLLSLFTAPACGRGAKSPISVSSPTPTQTPTLTLSPSQQPTTIVPPHAVINEHVFQLEIADDEAARNRGLSNRVNLPENSAMLFIFPQEKILSFWMKDTIIPLDILFLDSSQKIVDIQTMQPEPGVLDNKLHIYRSTAPAMYAIEMNAGLTTKYEFKVGMVVELNTKN